MSVFVILERMHSAFRLLAVKINFRKDLARSVEDHGGLSGE